MVEEGVVYVDGEERAWDKSDRVSVTEREKGKEKESRRVEGEDVRTEGEEKKEVQPPGGRECAEHASLPHPFVSL